MNSKVRSVTPRSNRILSLLGYTQDKITSSHLSLRHIFVSCDGFGKVLCSIFKVILHRVEILHYVIEVSHFWAQLLRAACFLWKREKVSLIEGERQNQQTRPITISPLIPSLCHLWTISLLSFPFFLSAHNEKHFLKEWLWCQ